MPARPEPELQGYEKKPEVVMAPKDKAHDPTRTAFFHGSSKVTPVGESITPGGPYSRHHAWASDDRGLAAGYSADHAIGVAEFAEDEERNHQLALFNPVHEVVPADKKENLVKSKDFSSTVLGSKKWRVKNVTWVHDPHTGSPDAPEVG